MAQPRNILPADLLDGLEVAAMPTARPGVIGLLWRWRYEWGGAVVLAGSSIGIDVAAGPAGLVASAAVAGLGAAAAMSLPASRRSILARVRCVVVQHRVRTGLANAWVQTRRGKLPVIVRTVPRPFGERMLLLCRAGITASDVAAAREVLRVACWAADVRVIPDERRPHLVTIDIIRVPYAGGAPTLEWPDQIAEGPDETGPSRHSYSLSGYH